MAKLDFLLQAVTARFHADELQKLLTQEGCKRVLGSVAFVLQDGVSVIAPQLKNVSKVATFFVGIRNDITSVQAVKLLLDLGVRVFAVDTGTRSVIFHPKLFLSESKTTARLVIGSANMTFSGLHNNIEAGAILDLDLTNNDDKQFIDKLVKMLDDLPGNFPDNVFQIKDAAAADALFDDGRLMDEDIVRAPVVVSTLRKGSRDSLKVMKLVRHAPPYRKRASLKKKAGSAQAVPQAAGAVAGLVPVPAIPIPDYILVWESKGLTERDLNIPSGKNTSRTGSMLWKKGAAEDIDQRHFFRDEVFEGLDWKPDPKTPHLERVDALFTIVVKGLNFGEHKLKLTHNTDKKSVSYVQKNSMTQIHWGMVRSLVAKKDLLNRVMSLYRKEGKPPHFLIEID
jgi:HKD family nuclease